MWPFSNADEPTRQAFPTTLVISGASLVIHADGSVSGDRDAFLRAIETMTVPLAIDVKQIGLIWMLASAIRAAPVRD